MNLLALSPKCGNLNNLHRLTTHSGEITWFIVNQFDPSNPWPEKAEGMDPGLRVQDDQGGVIILWGLEAEEITQGRGNMA